MFKTVAWQYHNCILSKVQSDMRGPVNSENGIITLNGYHYFMLSFKGAMF